MEVVFSWVKSGLLFGLVASVILMLSPNKAYAKHISMVVGLLFILVILHPIMEFLNIDKDTYKDYLQNLFRMELEETDMQNEDLEYYEEITAYQLMISLQENGYPVKKVVVTAMKDGEIEKVRLILEGEVWQSEKLDIYLKSLFGEEVKISYEME